ncbi:MAG: hypothetical protein ABSC72_01385 [Methylovirgula sp.]|jgi:hypothetical protein
MRNGILCLLGLGLATMLTTPAAAWDEWGGWFDRAPPSFYYQSPDGTYPSVSDLSRAVNGVPCGLECTAEADGRWGLAPPPVFYHHHRHYYPY